MDNGEFDVQSNLAARGLPGGRRNKGPESNDNQYHYWSLGDVVFQEAVIRMVSVGNLITWPGGAKPPGFI
jgi:hypothetical protein